MPFASVVLRVVVTGVCAAALTVALGLMPDASLPSAGSLAGSFDRLRVHIAAGTVLGVGSGGALTHGFGRRAYEPVGRIGFAVIAATPLVVLA